MYYIALLPLTQQFTSRFLSVGPSSKQYGWHLQVRIQRYKKNGIFWFMWPLVKQSQILKSCQTT